MFGGLVASEPLTLPAASNSNNETVTLVTFMSNSPNLTLLTVQSVFILCYNAGEIDKIQNSTLILFSVHNNFILYRRLARLFYKGKITQLGIQP